MSTLLKPAGISTTILGFLALFLISVFSAGAVAQAQASSHQRRVLQVGTYRGKSGGFTTIQAAVDAAAQGDWILIAPGTYHEDGAPNAGVLITTPGLHLRGLDRNGVVVDGTKAGYGRCSSKVAAQNFGLSASGRNGIEILKVDGVTVENLTTCNFMGDANGVNGNQVWWNGGDGSGRIGLGSYSGGYLTASSTFFRAGMNSAQYGIFVSNAKGPGKIEYSYASNMGDSAFYVGGCADCNAVLRHVHAQYSPQGFSGSNSGGHLVLEDSEWDHNQSGIVPSSLANDDPPSPQNGACPDEPTASCTIIQRNYVHDNNNPNTPAAGLAATVAVGTGIDLTGGQNNTVRFNLVTHNGSWGILLNDYADFGTPVVSTYCQGGDINFVTPAPFDLLYGPSIPCYFHSFGNRVTGNVFKGNGFYGNETNGDIANAALAYPVNNCFRGNVDLKTGKPTTSPTGLQSNAGVCGEPWNPDTAQEVALTEELGCVSIGLCTSLPFPLTPPPSYPVPTKVKLYPIPREAGMADPCEGVPENSWCEDEN